MGLKHFSVLLLLYVAADFANPMMPGAVSYPSGSVAAVQMERSQVADVRSVTSVVARFERIEFNNLLWHTPRVTSIRSHLERRLIPARRALLASPDRPPSSEDH